MCGIVGVLAFGESKDYKEEKIRQEAMMFFGTELLLLTQSRGKDATGVASLFADGKFYGFKMGVPSPDFVSRYGGKNTDYDGFLKIWRENFMKRKKVAKSFIGHCRKTSVGLASDNANNHPVVVGDTIIGVHNGTLENHNIIFQMLKCKRDGDVDSEAIMQLIYYLTKEGTEPFTLDVLKETCMRLQGSYSCIVLNSNSPNQVATFRDSRPAEGAIIRPLNIALIASDDDFLKTVLFRYQKMARLYNSSVKFPPLGKDDVEMKILPDDHAYVWDLSKPIEKDTDLKDLYVSERIPRTGKLWGKKTTSYNNGYNYNNNWNARNNRKTEVSAKPATGNKAVVDDDDDDGQYEEAASARVWSKKSKSYEKKEGLAESKQIGPVEIDISPFGRTESINDEYENVENILLRLKDREEPKKKEIDVAPLTKVPVGEINDLIGNPVKTVVVPYPTLAKVGGDEAVEKEMDKSPFTKVDPEAMKKASEMADALPKYENDDEVIAALDANPKTIKEAPLYALTNRIVKQVFVEAFAMGYTKRKREETVGKVQKRDSNFIALKEAAIVLANAAGEENIKYRPRKDMIDKALIRILNGGGAKNLSIDALTNIFSAGDFKQHPLLRHLKLSVMSVKGANNED